ncbi:MAG: preQ(1) synthase [Myxococcota bacterium]|jgi:7-cyano-7-deazaguanine reductase|nr:preQ(1) synthase [Myxococcota bacterium]
MAKEPDLQRDYKALDTKVKLLVEGTEAVRADLLLSFDYEHKSRDIEVKLETEEFSAVCPWTGLPDLGTLKVTYVPADRLLELKSYKFYLTTYRSVGIVQEHAAARILEDLVKALAPKNLKVELVYRLRGGIGTTVTAQF